MQKLWRPPGQREATKTAKREISRTTQTRLERGRYGCPDHTATYTTVITEYEADYVTEGEMVTYVTTDYYRNGQLINSSQCGKKRTE